MAAPIVIFDLDGTLVDSAPDLVATLNVVLTRTGMPPVPVATRPLEDVNVVMDQLRAGKVSGRIVLTPGS